MRSSESGNSRFSNEWIGGDSEMLPFQPRAFEMLSQWRPIEDPVAALICHGALSDHPHPEGLADPASYVDELEGAPNESVRKIMGGNLARLVGIEDTVVA